MFYLNDCRMLSVKERIIDVALCLVKALLGCSGESWGFTLHIFFITELYKTCIKSKLLFKSIYSPCISDRHFEVD